MTATQKKKYPNGRKSPPRAGNTITLSSGLRVLHCGHIAVRQNPRFSLWASDAWQRGEVKTAPKPEKFSPLTARWLVSLFSPYRHGQTL